MKFDLRSLHLKPFCWVTWLVQLLSSLHAVRAALFSRSAGREPLRTSLARQPGQRRPCPRAAELPGPTREMKKMSYWPIARLRAATHMNFSGTMVSPRPLGPIIMLRKAFDQGLPCFRRCETGETKLPTAARDFRARPFSSKRTCFISDLSPA